MYKEDDPVLNFVLAKPETYPYAQKRRLMYVALTRAKKVYLITSDRPSEFVEEIVKDNNVLVINKFYTKKLSKNVF